MPLSKNLHLKVIDYVPRRFDQDVTIEALDYLEAKEKGADFTMNETVKIQTGVEDVEKMTVEEMAEKLMLERFKEVETKAYQEAYILGLEDGKEEAFEFHKKWIEENVEGVEKLLHSLKILKREIMNQNETHLLKLTMEIGTRLAYHEISLHPEIILEVLKQSIDMAIDEEKLVVKVNPTNYEFFMNLINENRKEIEFVKYLSFEEDASITKGGCVIESNYGVIDARVEERVSKLWETLSEQLPKVKERTSVP